MAADLSCERSRLAIDQMPGTALLSFDPDLRCCSACGGAIAAHGYSSAQLIGARPTDVIGASARELEEAMRSALAGESTTLDVHPNEREVFEAAVSPLHDGDGRLVGGVLTLRDITAQRAAERALAEAERNFRAVIELSGDMLTRHDPDGLITYVSPASERVLGYRPEQLIGHDSQEFVHPDDVARLQRDIEAAMALGGRFEVEHRVLRADGSCIWVHSLVGVERDEHGEVIGGVGAARDITAEREAEEELARAEEQFRTIIELSGDMLSRHDANGRCVYVSPNSMQVIGYEPEQLVGRRLDELSHPQDREQLEAAMREARESGSAEVEYRVSGPDGACVWVQALLRARRDGRGRIAEMVMAVRDISRRKHREARLREITARFEGAFNHAPIGMSLVGLDGRWLKVNRELCRITGYCESELLDRTFNDITHPGRCAVRRPRPRDGRPLGHLRGGEALHPPRRACDLGPAVGSTVHDEHGLPQYLVAQTQDITERKELHERLSYLADHDPLTQLYNRRRFEFELERQLSRCRRYGERAALLMADLDHFKYVNDSLGHHFGDGVIGHVANLLRARLRSSDLVARLGGDEFAIIVPHARQDRAERVARSLAEQIEGSPFEDNGHRYVCSASIGVVMLDADTASAEEALVGADLALYDAKRLGRNRVTVYCPVPAPTCSPACRGHSGSSRHCARRRSRCWPNRSCSSRRATQRCRNCCSGCERRTAS